MKILGKIILGIALATVLMYDSTLTGVLLSAKSDIANIIAIPQFTIVIFIVIRIAYCVYIKFRKSAEERFTILD